MLTRIAGLVLMLLASPALWQSDAAFRDSDLAVLGESLDAYLHARATSLGVNEAKAVVLESLAGLRAGAEQQDPLRRPGTLGRALRLSRKYDSAKQERGKIRSRFFASGSFDDPGLEITYRLPKEYAPAETDYPLVLAIPDVDESPADHIRSHWMDRDIRYKAIVVSFERPTDIEDWDRMVVRGRPGGLAHVLTALRIATDRFAVDRNRVFVAGRGKSIPTALACGNYSPQRFAGIIGRAGDASDMAPDNFKNLPTCFAASGEKAKSFQEAARDAGHDNSALLPTDETQGIWLWMLGHPRKPYPTLLRLMTGDPFPTRVNWLRVAPSAPGANASAEIDRGDNSIRITTEGVSHVTLYLNDELVDLDRELHVVCNGIERTATLQRSASSTLDMLYDGTSDTACVFVTRAVFDTTGADDAIAGDELAGADPEWEQRLLDAGTRVDDMWKVFEWCLSTERERRSRIVLRRILRSDPSHQAARSALGYWGAEGQWFRTEEALDRYQRSQEEANASARGHVLSGTTWIHPDERSFANKGWVKDFPTGQWMRRSDVKRIEAGWARQDLDWISPDEASHVDGGLWRVDGDWIELRAANRRHSRLDSMWRIPFGEVLLHTTVDRAVALQAAEHMGRAIQDLQRVFGAQPLLPLEVALLRDEEQYDRFAFGEPDGSRLPTHGGRLQTIHSAFFAESWFSPIEGKLTFQGMGVGYWDTNVPNGDLFGVHAARLAVGMSFVEALDPSPKTVRKALSRGLRNEYYDTYQAEKRLPSWLRLGSAVYAERYFRDWTVAPGDDPWWARRWSIDNLQRLGGMRDLGELFAFALDPDNREDGQKLLLEAGLVVAFIVDGDCAPVVEKHDEFKKRMLAGKVHPKHIRALTETILAHREDLLTFTGL